MNPFEDMYSEESVGLSDEEQRQRRVILHEWEQFRQTELYKALQTFVDDEYNRLTVELIAGGDNLRMGKVRRRLQAMNMYLEFGWLMDDSIEENPAAGEDVEGEGIQDLELEPRH